jgi:hypothetical protein
MCQISAPNFIKQTLLNWKSWIDFYTMIMWDFSTTLSPIDRSSRQKMNKETSELNVDQMD